MATSHNRKTTERKKSFRRFIYEKALRKIRMLHQAPCASESTRILCAKRKIVRLRMIFHSAKNDFACCCKRFYAVYHLPHPYNEIERKKGSHPSFYLRIKRLRWTLHSNSLHKRFTEKFRSALWYNALRWTFSRHSQKRKIKCPLWFPYEKTLRHFIHLFSERFTRGPLHDGHAP